MPSNNSRRLLEKMKKHTTKRSLGVSILSLILSFAMLLGTTYAWFTDSVTSAGNIIQSGNLDIGMYWSENNVDWHDAEGANAAPVFSYDNWEPGYTELRYIKVTNEGSLAFKYEMMLNPNGEVEDLAEVIDVSYDIVTDNENFVAPTAENKQGSLTKVGTLADMIAAGTGVAGGVLLPAGKTDENFYSGEIVICITLHMQESAGNEYMSKSIGTTFDMLLYATQYDYEADGFGSDYDEDAEYPKLFPENSTASTPIELNADGTLAAPATMASEEGDVVANLPEGVKFANGTTTANLNVDLITESTANITVNEDEQVRSYDVHIDGIAPDNTIPVEITLKEFLPVGLNVGNFYLYHVENGATITMNPLLEGETPTHNSFSYDPATGDVTLYMASFSEVAVKNAPAKWEGKFDYSWYNADATELYIANADQLAAFSAIVGGMNGKAKDDFAGKTVKLVADINIGDLNSENGIVFYPIGYYNNTGNYEKVSGGSISSSVSSFEGTFDGNGYKVSNFYQNTWEMFGDYNDGYSGTPNHYKDAMGLFGYVYGGTIKNLTVDGFSSDGEFTPTGVIAAYACNATFENIAITNCNPGVYNTGNGGIVGIGGNSNDPDTYMLTFSNITIDNTNKITALWGSWDVACGGLIGMFRGGGHVKMTNCHVGAQIDVYNDVCGNYQYYWYRYAGMLIGTNKNMITTDDGYTMPETSKFEATGCTVHFGDWNNYYYCELVANSLASYTHDHQFSRLTQVDSVDVQNKTVTVDGKTTEIPASGRYNYVVVNGEHATENATCYHFVDGTVWNHEKAGYEDVDVNGDGEKEHILKEDRQHYYLPFNQLFTGYGWGVKHVPIYNDESQNPFKGVMILDRDEADSVEKFEGRKFNREVSGDGTVIKEGILSSPISGRIYKLSHLFNLITEDVRVIDGAITITVTNLDNNGNVTATLTRNLNNWADSELVFSGGGRVRITIQDYYYCTPTSIEVEVRNYPAGSKIRNFTYDGFADDNDYHFNEQADHITNGKHGTYEYDFGYGPEVLDYAHKLDSKGLIKFTAPANGIFTIAFASQNVGSGIRYTVNGGSAIELGRVGEPFEIHIAQVNVEKGKIYEFTRITSECGIFYVGYVPATSIPDDHTHTYYDDTTATCTEGGVLVEMCLVCGHKENAVNVGPLGHDLANEPGYRETCTETGKTAGVYCTRCDYIESGCQSIPAHGHTYVDGFCHCEDEACHQPQSISNVLAKADFTTKSASDYSDYGTNSFFKPVGNCDMSNDKTYLIMKATSTGERAYIEFTVTQAVTFYVKVSSTGRENVSKFLLTKVEGDTTTNVNSIFHADKAEVDVKGVSGHTLVYTLEAGTYRFVSNSTDRVGRVMTMTVSTRVINVTP